MNPTIRVVYNVVVFLRSSKDMTTTTWTKTVPAGTIVHINGCGYDSQMKGLLLIGLEDGTEGWTDRFDCKVVDVAVRKN